MPESGSRAEGGSWTIYVCPSCGSTSNRPTRCPYHGILSDTGHDQSPYLEEVEVVPAPALLAAQEERDQWKRAAHGDRDGVVTHEHHLHMLKAVVAERQTAQERAQEAERINAFDIAVVLAEMKDDLERCKRERLSTGKARQAAEQRAEELEREALSQARMKAECYEEWKIAEQQVSELKEALEKIKTRSPDGTGKLRLIWSDKEMAQIARAALSDEAKPE